MNDQKLGNKIYYLSKLIHTKIDINSSKQKLYTDAQGRVLHYLLGQKDDCEIFQKDIEAEFRIKRSTATELLQALEQKGYIKRVPTSYDARLKRIILLPKAKALEPDVNRYLSTLDEELKCGIDQTELDIFVKVIDKMINNMADH